MTEENKKNPTAVQIGHSERKQMTIKRIFEDLDKAAKYDKLKEAIENIKTETEALLEKTKSHTYYFGEMKAEGMQQVLNIINKHTEGLI